MISYSSASCLFLGAQVLVLHAGLLSQSYMLHRKKLFGFANFVPRSCDLLLAPLLSSPLHFLAPIPLGFGLWLLFYSFVTASENKPELKEWLPRTSFRQSTP